MANIDQERAKIMQEYAEHVDDDSSNGYLLLALVVAAASWGALHVAEGEAETEASAPNEAPVSNKEVQAN